MAPANKGVCPGREAEGGMRRLAHNKWEGVWLP